MINDKIRVGYAICGSFCTFAKSISALKMISLLDDVEITPIMSEISYNTDTRFGLAGDFIDEIELITGNKIIKSVKEAEPIGPRALLDILIISPCTGNTLGKLANGITDTSVTMAAKAHLRNNRPVLIAVSTNDALGASAKNIGMLMNSKNIYFVPMSQDNPEQKPSSIVADFGQIIPAMKKALEGIQIQPMYFA